MIIPRRKYRQNNNNNNNNRLELTLVKTEKEPAKKWEAGRRNREGSKGN